MASTERVLYTGRTHTTGGRDGVSRSDDGRLEVALSSPGTNGLGTNPEQLFAAGWSACFEGAIALAAKERHIVLPVGSEIYAEVDLNLGAGGYYLRARLDVSIPGIIREVAQALVDRAHETFPYAKAIRGNVVVAIPLV